MSRLAILASALLLAGCLGVAPPLTDDEDAPHASARSSSNPANPPSSNPGHRPSAHPSAPPDRHLEDSAVPDAFEPHVVVGVADDSLNVYHSIFYRPEYTQHPCTYIRGFSCDLPALNLSVGGSDWDAMAAQDGPVWSSFQAGQWYWIPRTNLVAIGCAAGSPSNCILPASAPSHGTATVSSAVMENPDALVAFFSGSFQPDPFLAAGIPVDIVSNSDLPVVPIPSPSVAEYHPFPYIVVQAAGNSPNSILMDRSAGSPYVISVGGAYAADRTEAPESAKNADVVSYFCRPTVADREAAGPVSGSGASCGTSFAAPTVAGALSKVILEVRRHSGYDGSTANRTLDPEFGLTIDGLRAALNATASYSPNAQYPNVGTPAGLPLNGQAPWLQWGWGFYDGTVAEATIAALMGSAQPTKPDDCQQHMANLMLVRSALYG